MLRGLEVEVNDFLPYPLLRLAEEMFARFQARNREEELQFGMFRVAISTYSETAFREALANALIHRDYTQRGAVHVQWSEEQLEISSPGGFPSGIRLDNLLVAPPHPRSPLLADAFKRTGLVERTGRGINRMFAEQLRVGRPAPDYGRSSDAHVVAVLPGGPANLSMTRWVLEQENQQGMPLRLTELQVLAELVRERRATTTELARVMQRTDAETRNILARMAGRGWIEARGEGKGRSWHLSAAVYRVPGAPPATSVCAASSRYSRSRWSCSTPMPTARSPGPKPPTCAHSLRTRPAACCGASRKRESSSYAENAADRNMSDQPHEAQKQKTGRSLAQ